MGQTSWWMRRLTAEEFRTQLLDKEAERDGDLRVVDESGKDYLYSAEHFVLVELSPKRAQTLSASYSSGVS